MVQQVCQSAYGTYIRGVTTVAARYIGHPAAAIPASEMVKTMMEEAAPKVNYLVQLETGAKKENAGKEQKEGNILEYAKKGAEYVEGYYDSYWKAFNGEQVIDEKYTLENLFSGNLTIEDIPDIPELINMVGATKGSLSRGVWNSAKGTFDTVKTLVTEPGKVWDAVSSGASDFIEHPWESTKEFVSGKFNDAVDAVWRSTPQDMAEDVGEIVGDVAVDALTAGSGAVIVTGLKTGAKKLTISAGKTVTKTVTKTAGKTITKTVTKTTGKTAIKEASKKTIKELVPDATTVKKWMPKDLPINEGWLKNVVTAGGDINVLKKNNYQAILPPNDKKSIKDILQKTSKNTAKETVGEFAENKAVNLTKDKIVEEAKNKAIDVTENKVKDDVKDKIVKKVKNKTVGETKNEVGDATKKVVGEYSKKTGDGVHTSPAVNETKVKDIENNLNTLEEPIKEIIWDNIIATQPNYPNTNIPRSFEVAVNEQRMWVHGNATEHIYEDVISKMSIKNKTTYVNGSGTAYTNPNLYTQELISDFYGSLEKATIGNIKYEEIIIQGNWEFIFSKPRKKGQLPVVKHAQFNGWH